MGSNRVANGAAGRASSGTTASCGGSWAPLAAIWLCCSVGAAGAAPAPARAPPPLRSAGGGPKLRRFIVLEVARRQVAVNLGSDARLTVPALIKITAANDNAEASCRIRSKTVTLRAA